MSQYLYQPWNTCRFCHVCAPENDLIKYGTRHYAHPTCYLKAGKKLSALPKHEIDRMPYFLLKDLGLLAEADTIIKKSDAHSRAST